MAFLPDTNVWITLLRDPWTRPFPARYTQALDGALALRHRDPVSTAELIYERSKALPEKLQEQVLDFVDALGQGKDHPRDDWSGVSLAAALRGMEDDQWPAYTDAQLAEDWR